MVAPLVMVVVARVVVIAFLELVVLAATLSRSVMMVGPVVVTVAAMLGRSVVAVLLGRWRKAMLLTRRFVAVGWTPPATMESRRTLVGRLVGLCVIVVRGGAGARHVAASMRCHTMRTHMRAPQSVASTSRVKVSRGLLIRPRTRASRGRTGVRLAWHGCVG